LTFEATIIGSQADEVRKSPPSQINYVAFSRAELLDLIRLSTISMLKKFKPSALLINIDEDLLNRDES
jgi:hypothetical protein